MPAGARVGVGGGKAVLVEVGEGTGFAVDSGVAIDSGVADAAGVGAGVGSTGVAGVIVSTTVGVGNTAGPDVGLGVAGLTEGPRPVAGSLVARGSTVLGTVATAVDSG